MKITFSNIFDIDIPAPIPTKEFLPNWYKKTKPYMNSTKAMRTINNEQQTTATIKKCIPIFDILTSGYFICSWADIKYSNKNNIIHYEIDENILSQHHINQASKYPSLDNNDDLIAKFMNPWAITTPNGYSCLFISPVHRDNALNILPAIVDTDTYNLPIHFPFFLSDRRQDGFISKGTPLVQVIPFQREEWEMEITPFEKNKTLEAHKKLFEHGYNKYHDFFWSKKQHI